MGAFSQHNRDTIDQGALRDLIPLNSLSDKHFDEISSNMTVSTVSAGDYLFGAGDTDNRSVYLLDGQISFLDTSGRVTGIVHAGTEPARYPLANRQPRLVSARATSRSVIATIDSTLLDVLLTMDQSVGPKAADVSIDSGQDWMTRVLQSEAFIKIAPADIQRLLSRLESVTVSAGDTIIRQGDEGDYFYIIREGNCAVTRKSRKDGWDVPLAELTSGDCFGEEALVSDARRNATITMLTDGSLMRLSKDNFLELLKKPLVHYVDYDQACAMARDGATWLDVRLGEEYANYSLNDSINIPLVEIRDQATELFSNRTYIICCDTGRRSAAAAFLLSQRGFEVFVLENGLRWDIPLADLGMTEESYPAPAPAHSETDTSPKPCVAVDASYDWHAEVEAGRDTDDVEAGTIQAALARLETEMVNYTEKSARAEAAVDEARQAREVLQEQLEALAALVHRKFPPE
jgi:CRP-like cAMP-binding protein/rhodanese-related sulfurtransferase